MWTAQGERKDGLSNVVGAYHVRRTKHRAHERGTQDTCASRIYAPFNKDSFPFRTSPWQPPPCPNHIVILYCCTFYPVFVVTMGGGHPTFPSIKVFVCVCVCVFLRATRNIRWFFLSRLQKLCVFLTVVGCHGIKKNITLSGEFHIADIKS